MRRASPLAMLLAAPAFAGDPLSVCAAGPVPIPDDAGASVAVTLDFGAPNGLLVSSVAVELDIAHPWVGDLRVVLAAPDGTELVLLDRPGLGPSGPGFGFPGPHGCGGDDVLATLTDDAADNAESVCSTTAVPVLAGPLRPLEPLGTLTGLPASGLWTLTVTDLGVTDAGELRAACVRLETAAACPADLDAPFGTLNFFDLAAYLALYAAQDPRADLAAPAGVFNFFDVAAYLAAYNAGCP